MATSLRLNGNRDLAAQYWGEAKRVLFQLNQVLEAGEIDTGARHLSYPGRDHHLRQIFFRERDHRDHFAFRFPQRGRKEVEGGRDRLLPQGRRLPRCHHRHFHPWGFGRRVLPRSEYFHRGRARNAGVDERLPHYRQEVRQLPGGREPSKPGTGLVHTDALCFLRPDHRGEILLRGVHLRGIPGLSLRGKHRGLLSHPDRREHERPFQHRELYLCPEQPPRRNCGPIPSTSIRRSSPWKGKSARPSLPRSGSWTAWGISTTGTQAGNFTATSPTTLFPRRATSILTWAPFTTGSGIYGSILEKSRHTHRARSATGTERAVTPFIESDGPPPTGNYSQHEKTITLYEIKKVNIWTGEVSTHLGKSYSHFPYTYGGSKTLLSLGYTTHDKCFTKIFGENLECGALSLTSLLECGEPIHITASENTPPITRVTKDYRWASSEVITLFGVEYLCPLSFDGDSEEVYTGGHAHLIFVVRGRGGNPNRP